MPNALTGAWTQAEKDTFQVWRDQVCRGDERCMFCNTQGSWTLYDFAMGEGAFLGLGLGIGPSKKVYALLICDVCGSDQHIDAQKIGMV